LIPSQEIDGQDTLYCYTFVQAKEVSKYIHKGIRYDTTVSSLLYSIETRDSLIKAKEVEVTLADKELGLADKEITNLEDQVANRQEVIDGLKWKRFKLKVLCGIQGAAILTLLTLL
jgi:hypothetical protein